MSTSWINDFKDQFTKVINEKYLSFNTIYEKNVHYLDNLVTSLLTPNGLNSILDLNSNSTENSEKYVFLYESFF